jgi:bile acid-coenzyme A ligase
LSCLVVGVPHADLGQVPHALVHSRTTLAEATVTSFIAERLAEYKVPRGVEFVDTPLRDDAGKARRSAIRDEVIARLDAAAREATARPPAQADQ